MVSLHNHLIVLKLDLVSITITIIIIYPPDFQTTAKVVSVQQLSSNYFDLVYTYNDIALQFKKCINFLVFFF